LAQLDVRKVRTVPGAGVSLGKSPLTIGRSSSNDVPLRDARVSRQHCIIESIDGVPHIKDLGSQKGTFINGERIGAEPVRLWHGDVIAIRPFELRFDHPEFSRPAAPPSGPDPASLERISQLESRIAELEAQSAQQLHDRESAAAAHADMLAQREQSLLDAQQKQHSLQESLGELTSQLESRAGELEHKTHQLQDLNASLAALHEKFSNLEAHARRDADIAQVTFQSQVKHIEELTTNEANLQRRVKEMETNARVAADTALRASRAMMSITGQLQMLEEAAHAVQAIDERLADAESAWAEMERSADFADSDQSQIEAAELLRQHLSVQLVQLHRQRDEAVVLLRQSAFALRTMVDRGGHFETALMPVEPSGRLKRWLRIGAPRA
jgi:pSer/pThr/pTyr-binding forkhead associated (FHA) protein